MYRRLILASVCTLLAVTAAGDLREDLDAVEKTYRAAVAEGRFYVAIPRAKEALAIGQRLYADDSAEMAMLVFDHGFALGRAQRHSEAYPVLTRARDLVRTAFGSDPEKMIQVEQALLNSAPHGLAAGHLERALELATARHGEGSEVSADIMVTGALRLWNDATLGMLDVAAATFEWHGNTARYADVLMWKGRKQIADGRYREAIEPLAIVVEALPPDHGLVLTAHANLVEVYEQLGERDRATEHCLAVGRTRPWTGNAEYQPLLKKPPVYPPSALAKGVEGNVLLEFTVDSKGFVKNPVAVESEGGTAFEEAAMDSVDGFRYAPRFIDSEAVDVDRVRQRIVFVLDYQLVIPGEAAKPDVFEVPN